jgi:hypothetical protein
VTIAQLAALIKGWLAYATAATIGQMKAFLDVTVGEVAWVAAALGYPSAPIDFSGIVAALVTMQGNIDTIETQILDLGTAVTALGGPQQATLPVILPTVPPTGYGGADATSVWAYVVSGDSQSVGQRLTAAGVMATFQSGASYATFPSMTMPGWSIAGDWGNPVQSEPMSDPPPSFDPGTILVTDSTVFDWLTRVYYGLGWTMNVDGKAEFDDPLINWKWLYWMGPIEFAAWKAAIFGVAATAGNTPPVWPGLAKVTLGTPVALTAALNVNVPMDGVLIALTATPPGKPVYTIGDQVATAHIGQVAFLDDNGEMEYPQNLSFAAQVYCPLAMAHSAGVKIRTVPGVSGSVTPWTINP